MNNTAPHLPKKKLTDEERAVLSKKLDDELEQYMEDMAAKKASEKVEKKPFDFDEWCKDIDQHPIFMNEKSDINKCLNGKYGDTIAAIQALKYSEDDSNEEKHVVAEKHKNDGNKHFQLKKYRWATDCYTSGIKVQCLDKKLNGVLYCNRAAAQKHIGNLRTALKDCSAGLKFDPTNLKGVIRGAECLLELSYGSQTVQWIDRSKKMFALHKELEENGNVTEAEHKLLDTIEELRKKAEEASVVEERNIRKARALSKKEDEDKSRLLKALNERKVNMFPRLPFSRPELMDWSLITVSLPQLHEHQRVSFDIDNNLQWPLLLQYPETGQIDVLTECNETTKLADLLREVLATPADWDKGHTFKFDDVCFFVSSEWDEYLMEVHEWMDFGTIFSTPGMSIKQGLPVIMVFTKEKVKKSFSCPDGVNKWMVD